ncbi:MAG: hypothetical protein M3065_15250 [Actinomycetota bacterium]|nr:hypothetical protein [Actinomycetota bacterium]
MTRFRPLPAALLVICVMLSVGIAASWNSPGISQDEGLLLEYPELIIHRDIPFRDFQSSYGPGAYLPLVAAYEALGPSATVERAVGAAYWAAVILAIAALLSPLGAAVMLCGGSLAVVGILLSGPPTAFGWYAALGCALWAIWLARRALMSGSGSGWRWAGAGMLIGVTASVRPDLGAAAALASLVLVAGGNRRGRWLFAGGFAAGLAPLGWNVAVAGASAFWSYFVQARLHTQPEAGVPLSSLPALLGTLVGGTSLVLVAAIRRWRQLGLEPMTRSWLALATLSVLLLPQFLQREDSTHFAFVAPVVLGLVPWALSSARNKLSALTRVAIPTVCVLVVGLHASRAAGVHRYAVHNAGRSFAVGALPDQDELQAVVSYVDAHTSPGQRIFVGPHDLRWALWADTSLYYLLPALRPASFYLEFGPGDNTASISARIASDLKGAAILVLESVAAQKRRAVYPYARVGSDLPNLIVARYFRLGFQTGPYGVFLRDVTSRPRENPQARERIAAHWARQ